MDYYSIGWMVLAVVVTAACVIALCWSVSDLIRIRGVRHEPGTYLLIAFCLLNLTLCGRVFVLACW